MREVDKEKREREDKDIVGGKEIEEEGDDRN